MRTSDPAKWFRLYGEFATDPKVQMLSEAHQRRLIMLFCLRCCNGDVTLHETEIAFQLRISDEEWMQTKAVFEAKGFIDSNNNILNWEKRQFASDSSTARVLKHRKNRKQQCNGDVTLQKRSVETETETEKQKPPPLPPVVHEISIPPPDGLDLKAWKRWSDYRKEVRKPIKPASVLAAQRKLAGFGANQASVVEQSIANGWQGLFALKDVLGKGVEPDWLRGAI